MSTDVSGYLLDADHVGGAEDVRTPAQLLRTEFCSNVASHEASLVADARGRTAVRELVVRTDGGEVLVESAAYGTGVRAVLLVDGLRRSIDGCARATTGEPLGSDLRHGRFQALTDLEHGAVGYRLAVTGSAVPAEESRERAYALVDDAVVVVGLRRPASAAIALDLRALLASAVSRAAHSGSA